MTKKQAVFSIIGTILLLAGGIFAWWAFAPGSTTEIVSVANRFQPDTNWKIIDERITAPRQACFGDVECPSLFRSWQVPYRLTKSDFKKRLAGAHYEKNIEDDCQFEYMGQGLGPICSLTYRSGQYNVQITVWGDASNLEKNKVTLSVEK